MITIICGDPGSGKTLYALYLMQDAVRSGRKLYTNIELLPACPFASRAAKIDEEKWPILHGEPGKPDYKAFWHYVLPGSVVVIDEADAWFDCTDHGSLPRDIRLFHKQHRKLGLDLIYLVQNLKNLYVRIRRMAGRYIVCEWNYRSSRTVQLLGKSWSRFLRGEFTSELFTPGNMTGEGYFTYAEASAMFNWYRTDQLLGDTKFYRWNDDHAGHATAPAGNRPSEPSGGLEPAASPAPMETQSSDSGRLRSPLHRLLRRLWIPRQSTQTA